MTSETDKALKLLRSYNYLLNNKIYNPVKSHSCGREIKRSHDMLKKGVPGVYSKVRNDMNRVFNDRGADEEAEPIVIEELVDEQPDRVPECVYRTESGVIMGVDKTGGQWPVKKVAGGMSSSVAGGMSIVAMVLCALIVCAVIACVVIACVASDRPNNIFGNI